MRCCTRGHCPVLNRDISNKKANIYYDIKTTWTDEGEGMFPDVEKVRIEKGIRLLDRQVSETICGAIVKYANVAEHIRFRRGWNNLKFRLSGITHKVVNVRVERRVCRDLQQDLHDIAEGIEVIHASDEAAATKAQKKERRRKAAASRVTKLEKLVREKGYNGLETVEQYRADKYLGADRICEMEEERLKPPPIDTQISFFINDGNFETDIVKLGKGCQICKTEHLSK